MRISDWSSDVCSSDLPYAWRIGRADRAQHRRSCQPGSPENRAGSERPQLHQDRAPGGLHLHARRNGGLMRLLSRLIPRSITGQITGLVAVSVLLGLGLVATRLLAFFEHRSSDPATRLANLTLLVQADERPEPGGKAWCRGRLGQ